MGEFDTGTESKGYASEGFRPEGGVTRIQTGKKGSTGRVLYKKGQKKPATRTEPPKETQQSSYENINRLTEKPKEQIKVEVNTEQVEQMNREINARELSTALIEGRVTKTPEGFTVKEETNEYKPIPEEEAKKFTAPKQISPQETQPVTNEVKFESPFPPTNPYPTYINALQPPPKQKLTN